MTPPQTLLQMAGANLAPAQLSSATLIFIDFQNEYLDGPIAVARGSETADNAQQLANAARASGTPMIHVAHKGRSGGLFDRQAERGEFISTLTPENDEHVIEKTLPNAFANTSLHVELSTIGRTDVIICGFMTHMCVSSTARAALDLGYRVTVDAASCSTRALPDGRGGTIEAATVHEVSLAALADRFAVIAGEHDIHK